MKPKHETRSRVLQETDLLRAAERVVRLQLAEVLRDLVLQETGLLFSAEKLAVENWEEIDGGLEIGDELRFENVTFRRLEEALEVRPVSVVCRTCDGTGFVDPFPLATDDWLAESDPCPDCASFRVEVEEDLEEDFDDELEVEPLVPPGALDGRGRP
jgi:hypothetical protein